MTPPMIGGIDLGGTKIEARLFDSSATKTLSVHRIPTPLSSFDAMADGVAEQVRWLDSHANRPLPVGISVPGIIDPETGIGFASNIPTTGHALAPALTERLGRTLPMVNDCMAFAYSEANGGAADGARVVMGLILGTGVGGGLCIDGQIPPRHAGLAVEVGHLGMPGRALERHGLPLWPCGCGRMGCMENYISGTGLSNLAEWHTGQRLTAEELASADTPEATRVMEIWADLAGDCLYAIQVMLDPDCVVLGGGLSNMAGIAEILSESLARQRLGSARSPRIVAARHGDSSGARGAALMARS